MHLRFRWIRSIDMLTENMYIIPLRDMRFQGLLQRLAGSVGGVHHPALAVPALAGQMKTAAADFLAIA